MKILFTCFLSSLALGSFCQSNTVSGGGDANGSGGSIAYSIGQIDYLSPSGGGYTMNEGVQQPFELFLSAGEELTDFGIQVFPNPTQNNLTIQLDKPLGTGIIEITDAAGRLVLSTSISSGELTLSLADLAAGAYSLLLKHNNQTKIFKIIKN